jgi:hypothetical protein
VGSEVAAPTEPVGDAPLVTSTEGLATLVVWIEEFRGRLSEIMVQIVAHAVTTEPSDTDFVTLKVPSSNPPTARLRWEVPVVLSKVVLNDVLHAASKLVGLDALEILQKPRTRWDFTLPQDEYDADRTELLKKTQLRQQKETEFIPVWDNVTAWAVNCLELLQQDDGATKHLREQVPSTYRGKLPASQREEEPTGVAKKWKDFRETAGF